MAIDTICLDYIILCVLCNQIKLESLTRKAVRYHHLVYFLNRKKKCTEEGGFLQLAVLVHTKTKENNCSKSCQKNKHVSALSYQNFSIISKFDQVIKDEKIAKKITAVVLSNDIYCIHIQP